MITLAFTLQLLNLFDHRPFHRHRLELMRIYNRAEFLLHTKSSSLWMSSRSMSTNCGTSGGLWMEEVWRWCRAKPQEIDILSIKINWKEKPGMDWEYNITENVDTCVRVINYLFKKETDFLNLIITICSLKVCRVSRLFHKIKKKNIILGRVNCVQLPVGIKRR